MLTHVAGFSVSGRGSPPASISRIRHSVTSLSLLASTEPALPPPTIMKSGCWSGTPSDARTAHTKLKQRNRVWKVENVDS